MKATFEKYILEFKRASGTSRGVLKKKSTYFIRIEENGITGIGEAALFRGLSSDDVPFYEEKIKEVCENISAYKNDYHNQLKDFPSIVFGLEQAFLNLKNQGEGYYKNSFSAGQQGIPINGLIWMGDEPFMQQQIEQKLADGFTCIKIKIGAIDFEQEIALIQAIRNRYSAQQIEIRVDANGAFLPNEALEKLKRLAALEIHSIEQPIRQGQREAMHNLCRQTPLAIALDEELIGVNEYKAKQQLLVDIQPQYIILKPALVGGFQSCDEWIQLAEENNIAWWITSALESNIGLQAIAEYTATKKSTMFQGLGTGQLFTNNIPSNLIIQNAKLWQKNSNL